MPLRNKRAMTHAHFFVVSKINKYKPGLLTTSPCHGRYSYLSCTIAVCVITEIMGMSTEYDPGKRKQAI